MGPTWPGVWGLSSQVSTSSQVGMGAINRQLVAGGGDGGQRLLLPALPWTLGVHPI